MQLRANSWMTNLFPRQSRWNGAAERAAQTMIVLIRGTKRMLGLCFREAGIIFTLWKWLWQRPLDAGHSGMSTGPSVVLFLVAGVWYGASCGHAV